ncbi:MAG: phasin family protein [Candidatus Competibacter sp.]|nr:phasin family protein [Candidatus Competibacter sp.]
MKADLFENQLTNNARDFARQIWLAGLGAFAKAQDEGGRFFETLVQEGQAVDVRMRKTAEEKTGRMKGGVVVVKDKVEEFRDKATGTWNKLEEVFQGRVARALRRLGVPTQDDIQQLFQQVELLGQNIQELSREAGAETRVRKVRTAEAVEPAAVTKIADPVT